MIKNSIIVLFTLLFSVTLVSAIISEPENPTLEITKKTQLTIKTETGPLIVQLTPLKDLKNNLIIDQKEVELQPNTQQTINLELKRPLRTREYLFINILYKNPADDIVQGDNTITLEVESTDNKPLSLTLKEDIQSEESDIIQMSLNLIPLVVIGILILFIFRKKWQKKK